MALIPGFEYDIFISYAHIDNIGFSHEEQGWIAHFYTYLKQMLDQRHGRVGEIKIWWDNKRLDGSVVFDKSIAEGVENSALMICLHSPGYQQSDYCQQELEHFHGKASKESHGLEVGGRSRILNVLLNNINYEEWPSELEGTTGFPFHDAEEKEDFGDVLEVGTKAYINQVRDLRDAIWNIMGDLMENAQTSSVQNEEKQEAGNDKFSIYLGEVSDSLRTLHKRVKTELSEKGFEVISGVPPPYSATEHQKVVTEALTKCDLAVHLLDAYSGREIEEEKNMWYPQKQVEISLASDIAPIIWVPKAINFSEVEEKGYQTFLKNIEGGNYNAGPYEFIRGSKSTLTREIEDFVQQMKVSKQSVGTEGEKLSVLLDTHIKDQSYAFDLGKALLENEIQPFINPQEDDPLKNMNFLADRIGQVRKMIFLYGRVSKEWVLERMSAALQLIITRNYPIEDFFVYMAPPKKDISDISIKQRFLKVNVVNQSNAISFDMEGLNDFFNHLKSDGDE